MKFNLMPGSIYSFQFPRQNFKDECGENFFDALVIPSSRTRYVIITPCLEKGHLLAEFKGIKSPVYFTKIKTNL